MLPHQFTKGFWASSKAHWRETIKDTGTAVSVHKMNECKSSICLKKFQVNRRKSLAAYVQMVIAWNVSLYGSITYRNWLRKMDNWYYFTCLSCLFPYHNYVIKWKHFPRYCPFVSQNLMMKYRNQMEQRLFCHHVISISVVPRKILATWKLSEYVRSWFYCHKFFWNLVQRQWWNWENN